MADDGHRDDQRSQLRSDGWLHIEWPEGRKEPMKYWLSTLSEDIPLQRMVAEAKMCWRIVRDYQDLKQKLGLGVTKAAAGADSPPRQPEHRRLRPFDGPATAASQGNQSCTALDPVGHDGRRCHAGRRSRVSAYAPPLTPHPPPAQHLRTQPKS